MKKMMALLMALCLVLAMFACSKKGNGSKEAEDVNDSPATEETVSSYPGSLPLGGETACGEVFEIPEEGSLEYLGSKVAADEFGTPVLLSWFNFTRAGDYENSVGWALTIYAYQNGEELWRSSYTHNDVLLEDSLYEDVNPGDTLEVCMVHELNDLKNPVTLTFNDTFEELDPLEMTVDLSEVEICMEAAEGVEGLYMAQYLYAQGAEHDYEALVELGYADNSYVELYEDGTGVLCVAGQAVDLVYDGSYIYIGEESLYYTLEDGLLALEGEDLYYEFTYTDPSEAAPEEEEDEDFVGETVSTPEGYVSITLDEGWYEGESRVNGALTLYHDDQGPARWVEIIDLQLTDIEHEMEYVQVAIPNAEYEQITIGENTYQMLFSDAYGPQTYLVAETSTGKAFTVEVRSIPLEDVMTMLESIRIY